jgi:son of sevenless-like protein
LQLTGDDSAQAFHNARQAQAKLPWYLKNRHCEEEIKLDFDGTVKAGTLPALVEHLVVDPLREC